MEHKIKTTRKTLPIITALLCTALAIPIVHAQSAASLLNHVEIQAQIKDNVPLILINGEDKALLKAQKASEKFIETMANQGIGFLSNKELSQDQRKEKFKRLLKNNFDMKTIARFSLGRYWRPATKKQQTEYIKLFEKMILNVYARRFSDYKETQVIVNGSRAEGKRDMLVHSTITPKTGQNVPVDWRTRKNKKGQYKVVDIIVSGVSMSLTQRADFSSVIQRGGGNVEVLLTHFRK